MIRLKDTLAGDQIYFYIVEQRKDLYEARDFINDHKALALDTESSGINCYRRGWRLRSFQYGNAYESFVIPANYRGFISWAMKSKTQWIGHNGPHDIRSIDQHLDRRTGVICAETYIPAHHADSRSQDEGGVGHGLKEQSIVHIDRDAGKWERNLKDEFKNILIPIEGEVYKSGPRKGTQKYRKAKQAEGWDLIDFWNEAYLRYAAADPILDYRLWKFYQPVVKRNYELYKFDQEVQEGYSELQRRAILLDVDYATRLSEAYLKREHKLRTKAWDLYQCKNINSGDQVAATLLRLKVKLRAKTDTGKWKTNAELLRKLANNSNTPIEAIDFIRTVLGAKQLEKRRVAWVENMLLERDENDRVHPSIKSLAARTTRSSVSGPALQQLPTQDHEEDL